MTSIGIIRKKITNVALNDSTDQRDYVVVRSRAVRMLRLRTCGPTSINVPYQQMVITALLVVDACPI